MPNICGMPQMTFESTATPFHQNDATPERRHLKNFLLFSPKKYRRRVILATSGAGSGYSTERSEKKSSQTATAVQDGVFGTSEGNKLVLFAFYSCVAASTMAFVSEESKCQASWAQLTVVHCGFREGLQFRFYRRPESIFLSRKD